MNKASLNLTTVAAVLSFAVVAACGGGGSMEVSASDSPEAEAYLYRQSVMDIAAYKMTRIGGMARGEIPVDEEVFVKATADLAALAGMMTEGFMPEGLIPQSRTLPEVWSDWDGFMARANEFRSAAESLAEAAEQGGFDAAQGLVQGTAQTCGGCHRPYRAAEE